jgi:2C-methyl-D-erythritol 2,4-cyclodiphosphate synthase
MNYWKNSKYKTPKWHVLYDGVDRKEFNANWKYMIDKGWRLTDVDMKIILDCVKSEYQEEIRELLINTVV